MTMYVAGSKLASKTALKVATYSPSISTFLEGVAGMP